MFKCKLKLWGEVERVIIIAAHPTLAFNGNKLGIHILVSVIPRQNLKCICSLHVPCFPDQPDSSIFVYFEQEPNTI